MKRLCLIFFFAVCLLSQAYAKKLYKYQDEQGIWHYSDKKPATQQKVEIKQLKVQPKRRVWLLEGGHQHGPEYSIRNDYFGPIEVELGFKAQQNVFAKPALPRRFVIQPRHSETLLQIGAVDQYQGWKYSLNYKYTIGDPAAQHDQAFAYYPPFDPVHKFQITQAFGGKFSHQDEQNKYAVDIAMPVGTPLYAARAGTVMAVENDFIKGGTDNKAFRTRANSIRIVHDDGSMAVYAHLQLESARVYPGLKVKAGQLIAYSGNTGFTTGPHLHFAIQVNKGMTLESVPFKFMNQNGAAVTPEAGMLLRGV